MKTETSSPACFKLFNGRPDLLVVADDIQTALGRHFAFPFRNQGDGVRMHLQSEVEHLLGGGHFDVEPGGDDLSQQSDIAFVDMAAISTNMDGNAVGSRQFGHQSCRHRIGFRGLPGLPHGRNVIDIDP